VQTDQMTLHSCLCQQFFPAISPACGGSLVPAHTLGEHEIQLWIMYETLSHWDA